MLVFFLSSLIIQNVAQSALLIGPLMLPFGEVLFPSYYHTKFNNNKFCYFSTVYRQLKGIFLNFELKVKGENFHRKDMNISFILVSF